MLPYRIAYSKVVCWNTLVDLQAWKYPKALVALFAELQTNINDLAQSLWNMNVAVGRDVRITVSLLVLQ